MSIVDSYRKFMERNSGKYFFFFFFEFGTFNLFFQHLFYGILTGYCMKKYLIHLKSEIELNGLNNMFFNS